MVELKTNAEVDAMAAAGAVVAEALSAVIAHAKPGQSTKAPGSSGESSPSDEAR